MREIGLHVERQLRATNRGCGGGVYSRGPLRQPQEEEVSPERMPVARAEERRLQRNERAGCQQQLRTKEEEGVPPERMPVAWAEERRLQRNGRAGCQQQLRHEEEEGVPPERMRVARAEERRLQWNGLTNQHVAHR